jgi:hypothetical protein
MYLVIAVTFFCPQIFIIDHLWIKLVWHNSQSFTNSSYVILWDIIRREVIRVRNRPAKTPILRSERKIDRSESSKRICENYISCKLQQKQANNEPAITLSKYQARTMYMTDQTSMRKRVSDVVGTPSTGALYKSPHLYPGTCWSIWKRSPTDLLKWNVQPKHRLK